MLNLLSNISLFLFANSELLYLLLIGAILCSIYYLFLKEKKYGFLILLIALNALFSFHKIGHRFSLQEPYLSNKKHEVILKATSPFDELWVLTAQAEKDKNLYLYSKGVSVAFSSDNQNYSDVTVLDKEDYFKWLKYKVNGQTFIKLSFSDEKVMIQEIGAYNSELKKFIKLETLNKDANSLIDEQTLLKPNLDYQDETYFDEIYHVRNAYEIKQNYLLYASVHPLLGTRLIALGIHIFGFNPFGYRFFPNLASILIVPLMWLIAYQLFASVKAGNIAATLISLDFMHFVTGRIATLEPFSILTILLMFWAMLSFIKSNLFDLRKASIYLVLAGIFMSLAFATKWTAIYSSLTLAILFIGRLIYFYQQEKTKSYLYIIYYLLLAFTFCVIVPIFIYILAYSNINIYPTKPTNFVDFAKQVYTYTLNIFNYHSTLKATHPFSSTWFDWLFDLRPIFYYVKYNTLTMQTISNFNNPLISLFGLYAIISLLLSKAYKDKKIAILLLAYFISLAWWFFIKRNTFAYHYYPSITFLILIIVAYFAKSNFRSRLLYPYLSLCFILFLLFLPAISGFPSSYFYIQKFLRWINSWYFG